MRTLLVLMVLMLNGVLIAPAQAAEQPLRQWKWHGGKTWAPNGMDEVYRIENRFNGLAITTPKTKGGDPVYVKQFHAGPQGLQRFSFEAAGDGWYRIRNRMPKAFYLEHPDHQRRPTTVIHMAEVEAYASGEGGKGEAKVSEGAKALMNSQLYNYEASLALNGKMDDFCHTAGGPEDWWEMDLGKTCELKRLVIHNRPWFVAPLRGCTIRVFDAQRKSVWSKVLETAKKKYIFELPPVKGQYVRVGLEESTDPMAKENILSSPGQGDDKKLWRMELVHPHGFYKIINKHSGLALRAEPGKFPYARLAAGQPVRQAEYDPKDVFMQWNIEPVRDENLDCLGVSQIGWTPKARKMALLVRTEKLAAEPEFKVTLKGKEVLKGQALYWGLEWRQHHYVIDVTVLSRPGVYQLECDGDGAEVVVNDSAYVEMRHRGGSDTTVLADIVDGKGFVGHWGHIDTWWSPEVMAEPYWSELDWDPADKKTCERKKLMEPRKKIEKKYFGGWDHTDLYGSSQKCSATVLRELALAWHDNPVKSDNRALAKEMIYGAKYFLSIQNPDGSWPYKTNVWTKITGIVASITSAMALASGPVKSIDAGLSKKMLASARQGWKWVEANPDKWLPFPISYRHGRGEERLLAAMALHLAGGDEDCRKVAYEMLRAARISDKGAIVKKEGSFPCQALDGRETRITLLTCLLDYDKAPADIQGILRGMMDDYYKVVLKDHARNGPVGGLEGSNGGYGSNVGWVRQASFLYKIYQKFGDKYGAGCAVADRVMDWSFGCNPFASSMAFGCGDVFTVYGWVRGYEKGSLLPGLAVNFDSKGMVTPIQLTATMQGYGNAESETGAGVQLIHAMVLRHVLRDNLPKSVTVCSEKSFGGVTVDLPVGRYNAKQLKAFGVRLKDLSSLKVPAGLSITLYEQELPEGSGKTLEGDQSNLADVEWDDRTQAVVVTLK